VVRLVVGGNEVSGRQKVVAREVVVRLHVRASGRSVGRCGVTHPVGEPRPVSHIPLRERWCRFVEERAAVRAARRRSARARREC
jgi:hypothetical protein